MSQCFIFHTMKQKVTPRPRDDGSLLRAFVGAAQRQLARMDEELRAVPLSPSLHETLVQLDRAGRPLSLRELAEGQHCVPSNITQKMDRLEREGLVRRVDDPSDRRVVLAEITPLGVERSRDGERIVRRLESAFEAALGDGDRECLARLLRSLS